MTAVSPSVPIPSAQMVMETAPSPIPMRAALMASSVTSTTACTVSPRWSRSTRRERSGSSTSSRVLESGDRPDYFLLVHGGGHVGTGSVAVNGKMAACTSRKRLVMPSFGDLLSSWDEGDRALGGWSGSTRRDPRCHCVATPHVGHVGTRSDSRDMQPGDLNYRAPYHAADESRRGVLGDVAHTVATRLRGARPLPARPRTG